MSKLTLECTKDFIDTEEGTRLFTSDIFYTFINDQGTTTWKCVGDNGEWCVLGVLALREHFNFNFTG